MFRKILFCTDFSEDSHWAFTYALDLAKTYKAKLLIFHATPEPVHPEQLSIYLAPEKLKELRACQKKEIDRQLKGHYVEKMGRFKNYQIVFRPFTWQFYMTTKKAVYSGPRMAASPGGN